MSQDARRGLREAYGSLYQMAQRSPQPNVRARGKAGGRDLPRGPGGKGAGIPRSLTTAADLVRPVEAIVSNASEREVLERLARDMDVLPVVEERSGKLVGVWEGRLAG